MYFTPLAVNTAFSAAQAESTAESTCGSGKNTSHYNSFFENKNKNNINGLLKSKWTVDKGGVSIALFVHLDFASWTLSHIDFVFLFVTINVKSLLIFIRLMAS